MRDATPVDCSSSEHFAVSAFRVLVDRTVYFLLGVVCQVADTVLCRSVRCLRELGLRDDFWKYLFRLECFSFFAIVIFENGVCSEMFLWIYFLRQFGKLFLLSCGNVFFKRAFY